MMNKVLDFLMGVVVGDALGVPFEFRSRSDMAIRPATDMIGFGTHNQPPGTWSDDSSLMLCLADSLRYGYDLVDLSKRMIDWKYEAFWSARGMVFDIAITTSKSILELAEILKSKEYEDLKLLKFLGTEQDNGNGSLMRIMPLLFLIKGKKIQEQFECIWEVSALTHKHIRAAMSCLIYLKLAEYLLEGKEKIAAYQTMRNDIQQCWEDLDFTIEERQHFIRVIQQDIRDASEESLRTGGYVIESLESSIWYFLQKENYADTVLSIINLGHDTDTSAAIAGGLAGLYYGVDSIDEYWLFKLA
ncbi:MAG: ADP-ribosylglycohydrolase family protein, partial [Bacteroidota bacterium]